MPNVITKTALNDLLKAQKMSLFPTYSNLDEAIESATQSLNQCNRNHVVRVLAGYHNTLLNHLQKILEETDHVSDS